MKLVAYNNKSYRFINMMIVIASCYTLDLHVAKSQVFGFNPSRGVSAENHNASGQTGGVVASQDLSGFNQEVIGNNQPGFLPSRAAARQQSNVDEFGASGTGYVEAVVLGAGPNDLGLTSRTTVQYDFILNQTRPCHINLSALGSTTGSPTATVILQDVNSSQVLFQTSFAGTTAGDFRFLPAGSYHFRMEIHLDSLGVAHPVSSGRLDYTFSLKVPEPASASGLLGFGLVAMRRRRR